MKTNKFLLVVLPFIAIFLLYLLFWAPYQARLTKRNFKEFYESNLNGKLIYVGTKNQGSSFKLDNAATMYVFYPYADEILNARHSFFNFASPGDLIVKPPFSDTLLLLKKNDSYKFTFRKFN